MFKFEIQLINGQVTLLSVTYDSVERLKRRSFVIEITIVMDNKNCFIPETGKENSRTP